MFTGNPGNIAKKVSEWVKAIVHILLWTIIGISSIATAYVILCGIWKAVKLAIRFYGM